MNSKQHKQLTAELRIAGATNTELTELAGIASNLSKLKSKSLPFGVPDRQPHARLRLVLGIGVPAIIGVAVGIFLVVVSQTVLPGSPLYPVQAASDDLAAAIAPRYQETLMMKRAEQVRQLITNHAPSDRVFATLADYKKQAASYKSIASNYAAFEYCKDNLQQAAGQATDRERQAIDKTLSSLADV